MSEQTNNKRNIKPPSKKTSENITQNITSDETPKPLDTGIESPEVNLNDYQLTYGDNNYRVYSEIENIPYGNIQNKALKNFQKEMNKNLRFDMRSGLIKSFSIYFLLGIPITLVGGISIYNLFRGKPPVNILKFLSFFEKNKSQVQQNPSMSTLEEIQAKYGIPKLCLDKEDVEKIDGPFTISKEDKITSLFSKIFSVIGFITGIGILSGSGYELYQLINNKEYGLRYVKSFKNNSDITYQISKPRYILDKNTNQIITIETNERYQSHIKNIVK